MSYFILGEWDDGGFRVFSSEHGRTLGVPKETFLSSLGKTDFKNAVCDGEKVRERRYRGVKRLGNFGKGVSTRTIVALDFIKGSYGYVTGHLGKKVEIKWKPFSELPYYDKYTHYGSVYYMNNTGEVFTGAYDVVGEPYPIYFKTYVKELVKENSGGLQTENWDVEIIPGKEVIVGEAVEAEEAVVEAVEAEEEEETEETVEEKPEVVEEAPVKPIEEVESIKDLVSKMVRWGKNDKESIRNITEIDIYKVMLLSQPDDSVVYIPFEVLKQLRYSIEHIVDRNMDMTKFVAICTMRVDGVQLTVIGTFDEASHMVRLQIVKSSRPQSDKIYDIQHIKENYIRITLRVNPERI